ncbi:glycosyl transferase family 8 [Calothrix sp. NIES-4071]|nr:glycosyl transferase family 8 [Calothrix sp. NIES-4071]BAZ63972.1 glycosyl transferase family 8 [Calothrix sp. NIES-4105]
MFNVENPVVIVCCTDNNYTMALATTVCSVIANVSSQRQIVVYLIANQITQANKKKIIKSLNKPNVNIEWLVPDEEKFINARISNHITVAAYYRILIPELLPAKYQKVIYLDSDVIFKTNIEKLWDTEVADNYVLAVQDMDIDAAYVSSPNGIKKYQELGIAADCKYFNSGILVINTEKWRRDNLSEKIINYINNNRQHIRLHDQDAMNAVIAGKWGELDPRWNTQAAIHKYSSWKETALTEEAYNNVINNSYVVHFSSVAKPWKLGCKHPDRSLFFQYIDLTAWSGYRLTFIRKVWIKIKDVIEEKSILLTKRKASNKNHKTTNSSQENKRIFVKGA